jgi:hypothetical protein
MLESRPTPPDFKEAMEIQMIYAALANEALGSYLVDPGRLTSIRRVFGVAYESLKEMWASPATMCSTNEVHIGCQCWPVSRKEAVKP